ncbi:MAG: RNA-dependent DNA polymerase, partial [Desulfofundulus sp.]
VLGAFLTDELHLTLNRKTGIRLANQGIDFVGYRIWPTHRRVRRRTVKKIKQRLRQMAAEYAAGLLSLEEINAVVQSYIG